MSRGIRGVLWVLITAGLFCGCGSGTYEESREGYQNPVTLKTVSMYAEEDPNTYVYQAINEEFMAENDYIYIEDDSQISSQNWKALVAADFAVDNEPDVIQFFTDANASEVLKADKFMTVDEIKEEYPDYAKDILPQALEAAQNPDGILRAVPTTGYWEGLYCNKDLFDAYGLSLPTDWDSFLTAIRVFRENGIIPVAASLSELPHYWIEHLLLFISGEEGYVQIPEKVPEDWVRALELLKELMDMGAFPENVLTMDGAYAKELFSEKKAAMELEGSWCIGSIPDQENTVVCPFPRPEGAKAGKNCIIAGISSGFYITKRAWKDPDKREAAVKFVMAHTSKEAVQRYWNGAGQTAAQVEVLDHMTPLAMSGMVFSEGAEKIYSPLDSRLSQAAYTILIGEITEVLSGGKSPEELFREVLEKEKTEHVEGSNY